MMKTNKMMALLVVMAFLVSLIECQVISTTSCGTGKGCVKMPNSCTSSSNCNFLMTFRRKPTDANVMEFEISSNSGVGWVALGFNEVQNMIGTRGEICSLNGGQALLQGFHATNYALPVLQTPATNTILTGVSLVNGVIVCRFSRPIAPTGYQSALGPAINPIFAVGLVSNGVISRHSSRRFGDRMSLLAFTAVTTTMATTTNIATTTMATTTMATTTMAPTTMPATTRATTTMPSTTTGATTIMPSATTGATTTAGTATTATVSGASTATNGGTTTMTTMTTTDATTMATAAPTTGTASTTATTTNATAAIFQIDTSGCGKTKGCFKIPLSCSTSSNCKFLITWKPNAMKSLVDIEVKGDARTWVAFGLNQAPGRMAGTYGEICYKDASGSGVKGFYASRRSTPALTAATPAGITVQDVSVMNGAVMCRYTRPFASASNLGISLNKDLFVVVASGDSFKSGVPGYHGKKRYFSTSKFNLAAAIAADSAAQQTIPTSVLVFLGILSISAINVVY